MSKDVYLDAVKKIDDSLKSNEERNFVVRNVSVVDARGIVPNSWILVSDGVILETGILDEDLALAISTRGLSASDLSVVDGCGCFATPGYIDLHAHGAWEHSFDDGAEGIAIARAYHMLHGTTRQVLSLITNPLDVMQENLRTVKRVMQTRPDVLGSHLEGPFLALSRKGAHDPNCLVDPTPERVEALLEAADGTLRQITLAPEREHGMEAIKRFVEAGRS